MMWLPREILYFIQNHLDTRRTVKAQFEVMCRMMVEMQTANLEYSRWSRDTLAQFLVILDQPEKHDELRETLHQALSDMSDEVARLEEHISTSPSS